MSLLDTVQRQCREHGCTKILGVRLKIGKASGIMADSLAFTFDIVKKGGLADGAVLEIEDIPLGGVCRACGAEVDIEEKFLTSCPVCRQGTVEITKGFEMQIVDMEIE